MTERLSTDCWDYDLLEQAARSCADLNGLFVEVGTREGGSLQYIIDALWPPSVSVDMNTYEGHIWDVISIDPYGHIPYYYKGVVDKYDYTNEMKKRAMAGLYEYVKHKPINLITFPIEDHVFFDWCQDGVPVYREQSVRINDYAFVFLDADHTKDLVVKQINFFCPRLMAGGAVVVDDMDYYSERERLFIDAAFSKYGLSLEKEGSKKAVYRKKIRHEQNN